MWSNGYLYYLTVKDEAELSDYLEMCKAKGWFTSEFREPDMNNQITAFAVQHKGHPFKQLNRLGSSLETNT